MHYVSSMQRYLSVRDDSVKVINAPSTFQRMMDMAWRFLDFQQAFMDDVVVHSRTMHEQLSYLQAGFTVIIRLRLNLKNPICKSVTRNVELLGHIVSSDGTVSDSRDATAI